MWTPPGCPDGTTLGIEYEAFVSLDSRQLAATRLSVSRMSSSDPDVEVGIVDVLDGRGAAAAAGGRAANFQTRFFPGPRRGILASVSPAGRGGGDDGTAAYIYSTVSDPDFPPSASSMSSDPETLSVSQTYTVQLGPGVGRSVPCFFVPAPGPSVSAPVHEPPLPPNQQPTQPPPCLIQPPNVRKSFLIGSRRRSSSMSALRRPTTSTTPQTWPCRRPFGRQRQDGMSFVRLTARHTRRPAKRVTNLVLATMNCDGNPGNMNNIYMYIKIQDIP